MINDFNQKDIDSRIKSLIEESGLTLRKFAISVKLDVSNTTKKYNGDIPWTINDINKICDNMRIKKSWLVDGVGEKFKAPDEILDTIPVQPRKTNDSEGIPLIPTNAMAGSLTGDDVQIMPYDVETRFVVPAFAKSDFCIRVEGNSMEPTYYKGDIIACKYVPMSGIWFQWGKVYVLATNQGVLVKHIEQGSDKEHVRLVSDNPAYQPFEIPTGDIHNVAIINGLIRVE